MKYLVLVMYAILYSAACPAQHDLANTGIIETTIDVSRYPCFDFYSENPRQKQYVIKSRTDYLVYQSFVGACDFPAIDFNKHTLLGMFGGGNNYCSVEYFKNVTNDQKNGTYIFTLNVLEKGHCKQAIRWHWHWVLVPKLPESHEVEFKINRIREKDLTPQPKKSQATTQPSLSNPCKTISSSVSTPGQNSVYGKIVAGPNRPVNVDGDNSDPYSPLHATVVVKRIADNKEVARFKSDVNGDFRVSLRPGDYSFVPLRVNNKPWPRAQATCAVTILANHSLEIRIEYDTGIR